MSRPDGSRRSVVAGSAGPHAVVATTTTVRSGSVTRRVALCIPLIPIRAISHLVCRTLRMCCDPTVSRPAPSGSSPCSAARPSSGLPEKAFARLTRPAKAPDRGHGGDRAHALDGADRAHALDGLDGPHGSHWAAASSLSEEHRQTTVVPNPSVDEHADVATVVSVDVPTPDIPCRSA